DSDIEASAHRPALEYLQERAGSDAPGVVDAIRQLPERDRRRAIIRLLSDVSSPTLERRARSEVARVYSLAEAGDEGQLAAWMQGTNAHEGRAVFEALLDGQTSVGAAPEFSNENTMPNLVSSFINAELYDRFPEYAVTSIVRVFGADASANAAMRDALEASLLEVGPNTLSSAFAQDASPELLEILWELGGPESLGRPYHLRRVPTNVRSRFLLDMLAHQSGPSESKIDARAFRGAEDRLRIARNSEQLTGWFLSVDDPILQFEATRILLNLDAEAAANTSPAVDQDLLMYGLVRQAQDQRGNPWLRAVAPRLEEGELGSLLWRGWAATREANGVAPIDANFDDGLLADTQILARERDGDLTPIIDHWLDNVVAAIQYEASESGISESLTSMYRGGVGLGAGLLWIERGTVVNEDDPRETPFRLREWYHQPESYPRFGVPSMYDVWGKSGSPLWGDGAGSGLLAAIEERYEAMMEYDRSAFRLFPERTGPEE
ncbi:MAG: hypothetical protein AAF658_11755, partial [Myxococcota bacterium]